MEPSSPGRQVPLEYLGDVGHPIEIAGANKTLPAASGVVIASTCRRATSRTSTTLKPKRGRAGIEPSNSFLTNSIEAE